MVIIKKHIKLDNTTPLFIYSKYTKYLPGNRIFKDKLYMCAKFKPVPTQLFNSNNRHIYIV